MRKLIVLLIVAAPLFATEPNPSPKQRELVEKMLKVMNIDANTHSVMDAMFAQIEKQSLGETDDTAEARETFKMFRERVAKIDLGTDLHEAYVRMYAKYFDEQELADLVAFHSSSTGQKALSVMPLLMRDAMQMGAEKIGPKLEKVMTDVRQEQEMKRPWRHTMADMRTIATAVEAYATDYDETYPAGDYAALEKVLVPTYIKTMPEKDMWGHPYAYVVSDDHKHYRIVSGGADTNFEWDSLRIVADAKDADVKYRDRLEDDLIYADGSFLQLPAQAKPKTKE